MGNYRPADLSAVELTGAFWSERLETVLTKTIPSQHRKLDERGLLASLTTRHPSPALRIPRDQRGFTPQIFWDSDVGKWVEAASYALARQRNPEIEARVDAIAHALGQAQLPDGYLNSWHIARCPDERWTNLRDNHELYCAGHLLEGAIAYFQATGRRHLLDVMERYVDHITETFGTGDQQQRGYPGHEEIELALVKLYRVTGDSRRLDLAAYFIDERGREPHYFDAEARARGEDPKAAWGGNHEYSQAHQPVREQTKAVGHAVRALYLYSAMADLAAELQDADLRRACETLWEDVTGSRMYVTGGFGPSARNEGFTADYDLPNDTAYAETCASVAMVFWAQRMLHLDLDGKYADVLERALYNGALAGLSRDGEHYFYDNKLESDGSHERWAWHVCPCCSMNVSRLIASVNGYFYSTADDVIAVHLYGGSRARLRVCDRDVILTENSDYPWSGFISLRVDLAEPADFGLSLRIPGWVRGAGAKVNGTRIDVAAQTRHGYLEIRRRWQSGDRVELELPMPVRRIYAHPAVRADRGRVALSRGPLVYCFEQVDNPTAPLGLTRLPRDAAIEVTARADLFDGVVTLVADGSALESDDWGRDLYRLEPPRTRPARLTAVPYFLWCNRGPNPMQTWISEA